MLKFVLYTIRHPSLSELGNPGPLHVFIFWSSLILIVVDIKWVFLLTSYLCTFCEFGLTHPVFAQYWILDGTSSLNRQTLKGGALFPNSNEINLYHNGLHREILVGCLRLFAVMPSLSVRLLKTQDQNRAKILCKELLERKADVLEFSEALGRLSFEKETEEVSHISG